MGSKLFSREIVKAAGLGLGAVGLLGGMAVGGTILLEKMEQQVAEGLQQAVYPMPAGPLMVSPAAPLQEQESSTGPTAGDYVVPGSVALGDFGVACYVLWKTRSKKQPQPVEPVIDSSRLTLQEEQAFQMIVSQFDQDS